MTRPALRLVWLWALVAAQVALMAGIVALDAGSTVLGLHGYDLLLVAAVWSVLLVAGVVWALRRRAWGALAAQAAVPVAAYLWMSGVLWGPLDAADNQDLIGMTQSETMDALDERHGQWSSSTADSRGTILSANGIDIYFADGRRVTRVETGPDPVPSSASPPLVAAEQQDVVGMPYRAARDTLLHRGGIEYDAEAVAGGTVIVMNGVRMTVTGDERVRRVAPSDG